MLQEFSAYGEVDTSALNDPSTYPKPSPFNKAYIVDKTNSSPADLAILFIFIGLI